jgi:hypothetical protein
MLLALLAFVLIEGRGASHLSDPFRQRRHAPHSPHA